MKAQGLLSLLFLLCTHVLDAASSHCEVCGTALGSVAYTFLDRVEQEKRWLCESCADLTTVCYVCGVPCRDKYLTLSDGRVVCSRDRVGVVIEEEAALKVCQDVDRMLEAVLGRFTSFPVTNVSVRLADRIDVRTLVGVAGNDFTCPNLLGYTLSLQKSGYQQHNIRLLTGLQKGVLQATYAHELAHAWVAENVPKTRQLSTHPDAVEGFCELIGYVVAQSYRDPAAMRFILENQYTRGQILLFVEAKRRFGMTDVFDWMQHGETESLKEDDLDAVRDVSIATGIAPRPVSEILFIPKAAARSKERLEVTSITIGPRLSIATINGRAFESGEERRVPVGGSNLVVRCVLIEQSSVLIEHVNSGQQQRLELHGGTPTGRE